MLEAVLAFAVVGMFTFFRVRQLLRRRRALGHPEVPAHMPVLAGAVAVLLFSPILWIFPSADDQRGFAVAALLAIGLGVGAGIQSGRLESRG